MTLDKINIDNQNTILMHDNSLFPAIISFLIYIYIYKSSLKRPRIHIESKEQFSWWSDKKTTFTFLTCFCCLRVDNKYSFCPFFKSPSQYSNSPFYCRENANLFTSDSELCIVEKEN